MKTRVVVLGAGFGGLELTTILSDAFGDAIDIVLIDKRRCVRLRLLEARRDVRAADAGRGAPSVPRHRQAGRAISAVHGAVDRSGRPARGDRRWNVRSGVCWWSRSAPTSIRPATPGLVEGGNEFYTVAGAFALRDVLPRFEQGAAIVGVTGKSFKCPPAPSETALLLHDYLTARGRREATEISRGDAASARPFPRHLTRRRRFSPPSRNAVSDS